MRKVIYTNNGQQVIVPVPPPSNTPSFFVFSLHKAGSTMLSGIMEAIGAHLHIPLISIAQASHVQGVEEEDLTQEVCDLFTDIGYGFYGFRYLPSYLTHFDLSRFKKILLVRDPRDILVSLYFSVLKSHTITEGEVGQQLLQERQAIAQLTVDQYVMRNVEYFYHRFRAYRCLEDDRFKLYRYEDVIFEKQRWIGDILNFLELELDETTIQNIAKSYDVFPLQEDPTAHIRQVTPGDYKQKLKPDTIDFLNQKLSKVLHHYGYSN